MRFTVVANPSAVHQMAHQQAIMQGLSAHGITPVRSFGKNIDTEHVAVWGWRLGRRLREEGKQVLVMERGYLGDRFAWTSLAWNGLNGKGTFADRTDDGERFARWYAPLKPWKQGGGYVLLMGQVPGDASLRGVNLDHWYPEAAMKAGNAYEMPVKFREHPMALRKGIRRTPRMTEACHGPLAPALNGAGVVVAWNSNAAVDAVCAGVPAVVMDSGSMAWDVSAHRIGDLHRPAREAWAHRLAWRQWSLAEIASGFALEGMLKKEAA